MLNGHRVPVGEDKKVLEIGCGNSCTIRQMYLMPQNRILLKNGYNNKMQN